MPSSVKTHPVLITREFASVTVCSKLYETLQKRLETHRLEVFVTGCEIVSEGTKEYKRITSRYQVPAHPTSLLTFSPDGFTHYLIEADYTDSTLSPDTLMTRGEFVMELLGIWEGLKSRIPFGLSTLEKEIDLVIEYTKSAYSARELMDMNYLRETGGV